MIKGDVLQGIVQGVTECLTKFAIEGRNHSSKKSKTSMTTIIQDYLKNRQIKQEKVKQIIAELVESSQKQTEELQQRLEQAKQNRKKGAGSR